MPPKEVVEVPGSLDELDGRPSQPVEGPVGVGPEDDRSSLFAMDLPLLGTGTGDGKHLDQLRGVLVVTEVVLAEPFSELLNVLVVSPVASSWQS